jgi:signal transduction histidine kinase
LEPRSSGAFKVKGGTVGRVLEGNNSRRFLLLFAATMIVPAACLVWLGWRMVRQDHLLERERVQERRDQAADLAAAALQRVLAEADEKLTAFHAAPAAPVPSLWTGATLISLAETGLLASAGTHLLFQPAASSPPTADPAAFAAADELEFRKHDLAAALHVVHELAGSADPRIRGEALVRVARIEKKLGDLPKAIDAYTDLGKLGSLRVSGSPAGLAAIQGRALLFEAGGRTAELHQEAAILSRELAAGRWPLTSAEFEFSDRQAREWLGPVAPGAPDANRLALAGAAEQIWKEWRNGEKTEGRDRRIVRMDGRSILALTRSSAGRLSAMLLSPQTLDAAWVRPKGVRFALTDADGLPVLGDPKASLNQQSLRPASATQLPWTLHAIGGETALASPGLSGRTRLLLAGIAMMTLLLLTGGYFIQRAILHEVAVARLQTDFVAAVSHEFRTPLTTVRQLSEMLVRGRVSSEERRQQFYETLLRESERLHRMVEGLLNFGRMEAGKLQYRFEPVDPKDLVGEVVCDFQREVHPLGYRIEVERDGTLPLIRADRQSLARVLWNLLDNAVKYSPDHRTIEVQLSGGKGGVSVRVCDRGLGIPAAEQEEIFHKFVRGAAAKAANIRGTGVGLAMARQIVAAHGGGISVSSEPGRGSVFTVLLPAAQI